jgi:ribosomal protein S17
MKIHKKTWKEAFKKIASGEKTFDARLANFGCKIGDILVLEEYDPIAKKYTGRKIEKKITFVLNTNKQKYWSQSDIKRYGILIMGFKKG